jgi:hypothetical protein
VGRSALKVPAGSARRRRTAPALSRCNPRPPGHRR